MYESYVIRFVGRACLKISFLNEHLAFRAARSSQQKTTFSPFDALLPFVEIYMDNSFVYRAMSWKSAQNQLAEQHDLAELFRIGGNSPDTNYLFMGECVFQFALKCLTSEANMYCTATSTEAITL